MKPGYVYFKEDYELPLKAKRGDLTYLFDTQGGKAECFWQDWFGSTSRCYPPYDIIEIIDLSRPDVFICHKVESRHKYSYVGYSREPHLVNLLNLKTRKTDGWYYISNLRLTEDCLFTDNKQCICDIPTLMARGCQCGGN